MFASFLQMMGMAPVSPSISAPGVGGPERGAAPVDQVRRGSARSSRSNDVSGEHAQASSTRSESSARAATGSKASAHSVPRSGAVKTGSASKTAKPQAAVKSAASKLNVATTKAASVTAKAAVPGSSSKVSAAGKTAKAGASKSTESASRAAATKPVQRAAATKTGAVKTSAGVARSASENAQPVHSAADVGKPAAPPTAQSLKAMPATGRIPARSGRPSSRLAQITVPSMAQSVASTAAKSSYSQTMETPAIAPPPPAVVKKNPKLANNWKTTPAEQLSDEEVLAMPDAEYMNEQQMAFFRLKLQRLRADMLSNAGQTTENLREDTVVVPDPADRATIEEEHALELRTRDRERKLLKKIEQSIAHIDAGDYGFCDETGEPIGVGRLLARPTATLSLEAQQRRELKQKMFGD